MNLTKTVFALSAALVLQACTATLPKESTTKKTPEMIALERTSSLNIYDDNRVAFEFDGKIAWMQKKSDVFTILFKDRIYNTKDLTSIEFGSTKNFQTITLNFKNGEKASGDAKSAYWMMCDIKKVCGDAIAIKEGGVGSYFQNEFKTASKSFLETTHPRRATKYDIAFSFDVRPSFILNKKLTFLSDYKLNQIESQISKLDKLWEAGKPARDAEELAAKNAFEQRERIRISALKSAPIGAQVYCRATISGYEAGTPVNCNNYGMTRIDEMNSLGWNVISSQVISTTAGNFFEFYAFTFQKVK